jgi:YidC/Oxa1 family membrane protein insertase
LDNQRNMILAIVLSMLVLFGWNVVSERLFPQPKRVATAPNTTPGAPTVTPTSPSAVPRVEAAKALASAPRVAIESARVRGSINLTGAVIDDLVLLSHKETIAKDSPPVRLLAPATSKTSYFAGFGWAGDQLAAPDASTVWQADGAKLTPETPVTLSWANANGQVFKIRLALDKDYLFTITQSMTNNGAGAVGVKPYAYVSRLGQSKDPSSWTNHVGPIGAFNGAVNYKVDWDDVDEAGPAGQRFQSKGGWIGFGDHYWLTALIPDQAASIDAGYRAGSGSYQAEYSLPQAIIAPGSTSLATSKFFAGGKEVAVLDTYEKAGIPLFGKAIDWGWFEIIAKPFFYLLDWLFKLVGNFGVAIIMLTFIVRGLMFPIAQRQFASMAAMRVVQPKLKAIQEQYKDDRTKMQQETMALYQKEKINPVAGCLPVLLQIPVFYALYKVLMLAIEMRHKPFFGWIHDLSAPDPKHILNLFGLLDFTPPAMLGIGILAILLGVTMWLQFKLNPAPMDPVQQQMFALMPWFMMFVMAPFASGLLIYWIVSNVLTIAQQKFLYSRHPALKTPLATT